MVRQITITGDLGSGKSTVGKLLAAELGFQFHSTGAFQRALAAERELSSLELNVAAESDPSIDAAIDGYSCSLRELDDIVVDSRLAWHFLPASYKVCLVVDPAVAAVRISSDDRGPVEKYRTTDQAAQELRERRQSERKRYIELYGIDIADLNSFDLVVDTSELEPVAVVKAIRAGLSVTSSG